MPAAADHCELTCWLCWLMQVLLTVTFVVCVPGVGILGILRKMFYSGRIVIQAATSTTEIRRAEAYSLFQKLDVDSDGVLTLAELKQGIGKLRSETGLEMKAKQFLQVCPTDFLHDAEWQASKVSKRDTRLRTASRRRPAPTSSSSSLRKSSLTTWGTRWRSAAPRRRARTAPLTASSSGGTTRPTGSDRNSIYLVST